MAGCEFNPALEIKSFESYRVRLEIENPDLSPETIQKQALIVYNETMLPAQVKSYLAEKSGEINISSGQAFQIDNGQLINEHYNFANMIDHASSEAEKISMINFQDKAVTVEPGEKICVLDLSALGSGGGVKYLDVYEKESETVVRHKERIDLSGNGSDLPLEEAQKILTEIEAVIEQEPDFAQELPVMVEQARQPLVLPELVRGVPLPEIPVLMPVFESEIIQTNPVIDMPRNRLIDSDNQIEAPEVKPEVLVAVSDTVPTGTVLEGRKTVDLTEEISRMNLEVTKAYFGITSTPVLTRKSIEEESEFKSPVKTVSVSRKLDHDKETPILFEQPTRLNLIPEIKKDKPLTAVSNLSTLKPKTIAKQLSTQIVFAAKVKKIKTQSTYEIPHWIPGLTAVNENEIPIWQPKNITIKLDYTIYILAFYFALLNTNKLQFNNDWGSGEQRQPAVVCVS